MAKLAGAGETFIFDKLPYRLEIAKNLYRVDHAVNSGAMDPVEYIKKHTNNRGVDISIEAAGAQETFWWTFESARIGEMLPYRNPGGRHHPLRSPHSSASGASCPECPPFQFLFRTLQAHYSAREN